MKNVVYTNEWLREIYFFVPRLLLTFSSVKQYYCSFKWRLFCSYGYKYRYTRGVRWHLIHYLHKFLLRVLLSCSFWYLFVRNRCAILSWIIIRMDHWFIVYLHNTSYFYDNVIIVLSMNKKKNRLKKRISQYRINEYRTKKFGKRKDNRIKMNKKLIYFLPTLVSTFNIKLKIIFYWIIIFT